MWINVTFRCMVAIAFSALMFGGCYTMIYHKEFRHLEEKPDNVEEETDIINYPFPDIYPDPYGYPDPIIIVIPAPPPPPATAAPVKYREPDNNNDRHRDGDRTTIRNNDGNRSGNNDRSDKRRR